jgi:hypothetical protein
MAAIDESNTTIGIADSDLYFASPAEVDAALDQMQAMGVNTIRIGIPWAGINPVPGYYNWSQSDYMINAATRNCSKRSIRRSRQATRMRR